MVLFFVVLLGSRLSVYPTLQLRHDKYAGHPMIMSTNDSAIVGAHSDLYAFEKIVKMVTETFEGELHLLNRGTVITSVSLRISFHISNSFDFVDCFRA